MTQNVLNLIKKSLRNFFKKRLFIVKVHGNSMIPHLKPGEIYLAYKTKKIKTGDIVVFQNNKLTCDHHLLVKKVTKVEKNLIWVEGSHPFSLSSKELGYINKENILGKILW